jgi:hypothetical protein
MITDSRDLHRALFKTAQSFPSRLAQNVFIVKISQVKILAVRCPTCGAAPGEQCELSTGMPRTFPHRDRCPAAKD